MTEVEKIKEAQMLRDEDSFTRARSEAHEVQEMRDRLAKVEAESASRTRNRLEKGSPSWARRNFADILNGLVADSASRELPGLAALEGVCKRQQLGYRTAADHNAAYRRYEKSEAFNRLHPSSLRRSEFEIGADSPGNRDGSRFEPDERYTPRLSAGRVPDAGGSIRADSETRLKLWARGVLEATDARFLLDATRALLEAVKERSARFEGKDR